MSCVSPDLHGDIKKGQDSFLMSPVSRIDLSNLRSSRNFWVSTGAGSAWSATGVSRNSALASYDEFSLEAGLLWQKLTRRNRKIGLKAEIVSFVPSTGEPLEIMQVSLTNISGRRVNFTPTAAIPMYNRGANNIRDHRHVTSLLQRVFLHKFGVIARPTLSFDEAGHHPNRDSYFVLGWDEKMSPPQRIYPTQECFCGDSGDLEEPQAVFGKTVPRPANIQGKEVMGGLSFRKVSLAPAQTKVYTLVMGITEDAGRINRLVARFNSPDKVSASLRQTRVYWSGLSRGIDISTRSGDFDNWLRWVNIQPALRKIYGCSFLPDHDYGKGGRGWRDLWQDCLGLILSEPEKVRPLLINNFRGVKIDGSNATIIGKAPGEFIADRDNISRVWMDHGVWPLLTLDLYINETGDSGILFENADYFYNHQIKRAAGIDSGWTPAYGNKLKTRHGKIYSATVFEHLLVQNLVQFFNVGRHNHVRLEGADWNDGLDMASVNGESVAFSAMYAENLDTLACLLVKAGKKDIELAEEFKILLAPFDYDSVSAKRGILDKYFSAVSPCLSGRKVVFDCRQLASWLEDKSAWMKNHIRSREYLKEGFFNGYYDNRGERVEGKKGGCLRMTLTAQTFAVMAGLPGPRQMRRILRSVNKYLADKDSGGLRLNTDFKLDQLHLGRAFSFSYGDKENGAVFSHMAVMFSYALYKQGYCRQAWEVLNSLYKMSMDKRRSKIYPCLPEYFNLEGRGMYPYLTGSASWFMLTMLTRVFGVRGVNGDLMVEPKLEAEHFDSRSCASVERNFAGRRIQVKFLNPKRLACGRYKIVRAALNAKELPIGSNEYLVFSREVLLGLPAHKLNSIEIHLA